MDYDESEGADRGTKNKGGMSPAAHDLTSLMERTLLVENKYEGDDQICFNCVLRKQYDKTLRRTVKIRSHHWDGVVPILTFHPKQYLFQPNVSVDADVSSMSSLNVALLPYAAVPRFCSNSEESLKLQRMAVVLHCHAVKKRHAKLENLQKLNLLPPKNIINVTGLHQAFFEEETGHFKKRSWERL